MNRYSLLATLCVAAVGARAQQVDYSATDIGDVWAYEFSASPKDDPEMRVWGDGTNSTGGYPPMNIAYGYMQWQLTGFAPATQYQVSSAKLTVWQKANPSWTLASPNIEAHTLASTWSEGTWKYSDPNPAPGGLLANGDRSGYVAGGANFKITFDLTNTAFEQELNSALTQGDKLSISVNSAILPAMQAGPFYDIFTRDAPIQGVAPLLEITAKPVPEPSTFLALLGAVAIARRAAGRSERRA